jgi:serine/threonine protein phosphatase PrpC
MLRPLSTLADVLTPEQARTHPRRNVLTRALSGGSQLAVDHSPTSTASAGATASQRPATVHRE